MQICGNGPVHSAAFVHLAASCAQAPTLMSALEAMIAANSIELLMVMISLPLMLSETGNADRREPRRLPHFIGNHHVARAAPGGSSAEELPMASMLRNQRL